MNPLTKTQWLVLNATADDFEDLERIYRAVCLEFSAQRYNPTDPESFYWREARDAAPLSEVVEALLFLIGKDFLSVRLQEGNLAVRSNGDLSFVWRGWFGITDAGRTALLSRPKGDV